MKITLINQETREATTYDSRGISMGVSIRAFELQEEIQTLATKNPEILYEAEHREKLLDFVVELFRGQFTAEQLLNECEDSFYTLVPGILASVVSGVNARIKEFPETEKEAPNAAAPKAGKKKA